MKSTTISILFLSIFFGLASLSYAMESKEQLVPNSISDQITILQDDIARINSLLMELGAKGTGEHYSHNHTTIGGVKEYTPPTYEWNYFESEDYETH